MQATADAIEAKRLSNGLTHQGVTAAIGVSREQYWHIRRGDRRMYLRTCRRVMRFLGINSEEILRSEGYWEKLSPVGRVIAPAMLAADLDQPSLATMACGGRATTVHTALWGKVCPEDATLERFAVALALDLAQLRRAAREMKQRQPKRPMTSRDKEKLLRQTQLIKGAKGSIPPSWYGDKLQELYIQKLTPKQRRENAMAGTRASAERWATATDDDRKHWGRTRLSPRPRVRFGLCVICGKLTSVPESAVEALEASATYHHVCWLRWSEQHPGFARWAAQLNSRGQGENVGPRPEPARPEGRKLNAKRLADYYETTVRYLRMRELAACSPGTRWRHRNEPQTVRELASRLGLKERRLQRHIERLLELLPDPSVCSRDLAHRVEVLGALRSSGKAA